MAKRKWYVVVVGKEIGVFSTWLEAGPLVKGVPNAVYQGFSTREEAEREFDNALLRGTTRVVDPDALPNRARRPSEPSPAPFIPFTPPRPCPPAPTPPARMNGTPSSAHTRRLSSPQSPPFSCTTSEPSPSLSRLQLIRTALDDRSSSSLVGVETRSPSATGSGARNSTPTTLSGRSLQRASTASPELFRNNGSQSPISDKSARTPRVIVQTPSWLPSYPKAEEPLSPLCTDTKLKSFSIGDQHTYVPRSPSLLQNTAASGTSSSTGSPMKKTPNPSPATSSIRAGRGIIEIKHDTDTRSPILDKSKVPELAYQSFYFMRPSPRAKHEPCPNTPLSRSLLFSREAPLSPHRR